MKDVAFGQYYPAQSFVHKMDARIKIIITIAYIVGVFLCSSNFLGFGLCLFFVVLASILSKVPFLKILKSVKGVMFFVILSAVLQLFLNKSGTPLWENGFITDEGLISAIYIVLRIVFIIVGSSLLTLTTSPVEIADGLESLMYPLKLVKFPVHEFALIMSIALRFIPTLIDETDRIIKAQKARGANFDKGGLLKRAKALIPVLIPLLVGSFRRADELADAMDARCYAGSKKRTKYKKQTLTYRDFFGFILTAGLIVGIVFINGVVL